EVRDLAEPPRDPTARAGVVVRHDGPRASAGAKARITALPVPGGVEAVDARRNARRRRDPGTAHADAPRRVDRREHGVRPLAPKGDVARRTGMQVVGGD